MAEIMPDAAATRNFSKQQVEALMFSEEKTMINYCCCVNHD
jgi:hypothetical protein